MNKIIKHELKIFLLYSFMVYLLLIPFKIWVTGISISLILGILFGILNGILTQLRMLNGEKFENLSDDKKEEKPTELIKS